MTYTDMIGLIKQVKDVPFLFRRQIPLKNNVSLRFREVHLYGRFEHINSTGRSYNIYRDL